MHRMPAVRPCTIILLNALIVRAMEAFVADTAALSLAICMSF